MIGRPLLVLAANRALWGEVRPSLRAALVREKDAEVQIRFIVDGQITDEDDASLSVVATELAADFPAHRITESCLRIDRPKHIPSFEDWHLIFLRQEQDARHEEPE